MKFHQGETIDFSLGIKNAQWSEYGNIVVYVYTNPSCVYKYSTRTGVSGYGELAYNEGQGKLTCRLTGAQTKPMLGAITMEVYGDTGTVQMIKRMQLDIEVLPSVIKAEV